LILISSGKSMKPNDRGGEDDTVAIVTMVRCQN
jgi:hypothetical protein